MRLDHMVSVAIRHLMGRLFRRVVAMAALALLVLVTAYHLTVAGTIALEQLYGPLYARLIVAGIYAALALIVFGYLFATRAGEPEEFREPKNRRATRSRGSQDARMAALLESVLLGFAAARGKSRHS
jgi:type VI protein secretion system component VasK